jgi:energy-coupling factor transporter ATP-binding protein EcfA2
MGSVRVPGRRSRDFATRSRENSSGPEFVGVLGSACAGNRDIYCRCSRPLDDLAPVEVPMFLRNFSDSSVLAGLARVVRQGHAITAALLGHILEIEHRQLYRNMGYDSMRAFLIVEHHFSEDAAERRLQAAHAVRRHPELLERVADGRLHLTAVGMLSAHLDDPNAAELIEAATHRTRSQIHALLLARKPVAIAAGVQPEMALSAGVPAPAQVGNEPALAQVEGEPALAQVPSERLSKIAIRESTRQKLRRAHDLVTGAVPFGDHDRVIAQALDEFIARREKRKFATTAKPRISPRPSSSPRTIPAEVRRAVYQRDGGQCTYVGPTGHRCESRAVQFDHVVPIAQGGTSTVANVRLLCGPHNQLVAEQAFGRAFMERRRSESDDPVHRDLVSGLRSLGYRAAEANEAAAHAMQLGTTASLETRMRAALAFFRPKRVAIAAT